MPILVPIVIPCVFPMLFTCLFFEVPAVNVAWFARSRHSFEGVRTHRFHPINDAVAELFHPSHSLDSAHDRCVVPVVHFANVQEGVVQLIPEDKPHRRPCIYYVALACFAVELFYRDSGRVRDCLLDLYYSYWFLHVISVCTLAVASRL